MRRASRFRRHWSSGCAPPTNSARACACGSRSATWTYRPSPLIDGAHTVAFRSVDAAGNPSLVASRVEQRYEPLADRVVRYSSGSFTADIRFDADGLVVDYPGLARRLDNPR